MKRCLNLNKLKSRKRTTISSKEALKDVTPIKWSKDVLTGEKVIVSIYKKKIIIGENSMPTKLEEAKKHIEEGLKIPDNEPIHRQYKIRGKIINVTWYFGTKTKEEMNKDTFEILKKNFFQNLDKNK